MDDVILHYGVKGMRWGIRRRRRQNAGDGSEEKPKKLSKRQRKKLAKEELEKSRRRAKSWKKEFNNREKLSNEELKSKIERLKLENEFDRLANEAVKNLPQKKKIEIQKAIVAISKIPYPIVENNSDGNPEVKRMSTVGDVVTDQLKKELGAYVAKQMTKPKSE